jgi:hypothetical protein
MFAHDPHKGNLGNFSDAILGKSIYGNVVFILSQRNYPYSFHYPAQVYAAGTAGCTGQAGSADPGCLRIYETFFKAELSKPDYLVGKDVHCRTHGATGGTFAALVAVETILPRQLVYFFYEVAVNRTGGNTKSHSAFHLVWICRA